MKKNLLILLGILVFHTLFAQNEMPLTPTEQRKIDSLKAKLAASSADTNRVKMLFSLGWTYDIYRPVSAEPFFRDAMQLALKLDNKRLQSASLRNLAIILMGTRRTEALTHLLHALRISEDIQDKNEIGQNTKQLGVIYMIQKDYDKARAYLWRSKDMLMAVGNNFDLSLTLSGLGLVSYETGHEDSALLYSKKSVELGLKTKMSFVVPHSLNTLGNVYAKRSNYPVALKYYKQSVSYNEPTAISQAYLSIATIFHNTGQPDSALFYGKLSFNTGQGKDRSDAGKFLSGFYYGKDVAGAYKYLKIATQIADSMRLDEESLAIQNISFQEQQNKQELEVARVETRNRMRLFFFIGALLSLVVIAVILFRNNRHKQRANELLQKQKKEIEEQRSKAEQALKELEATQAQLVQSEKMASLGELTAGIAHEIQNPLNFINNFSEVNTELIDEMQQELKAGNKDEAIKISTDIKENQEKINHHGKRADAIVKGMIQHSRNSTGKKVSTDINALADEYLRLSYHGLRAKDKEFNADFKTDFDAGIGKIEIVQQDIGRVLLNLYNNAFYSVNEKKKLVNESFEPTVLVSTKKIDDKSEIRIKDNGNGIPKKVLDKIFQPFFTTKPTGQGTGLGLSLSYDIVKAHGGDMKVETKEGEGAEFIIQLPNK